MTRRATPDLLPGTLDLILRTLQTEPLHGWVISKRVNGNACRARSAES